MQRLARRLPLIVASAMLILGSCKKESEPAPASPAPPAVVTCPSSVTDIDGNTYPVVNIGGQCWMASNLRTSHYRDGAAIENVTDFWVWSGLSTGAWCNYQNHPGYGDIYGKLYNWYAVANNNLCPQDWHVPTDNEWKQLETALGMPAAELDNTGYRGIAQNVGGQMRSQGMQYWFGPNSGATNASGFSGLPGSSRNGSTGHFFPEDLGGSGYWWSATESGSNYAWFRRLSSNVDGIYRNDSNVFYYKRSGFCVRCVKD